MTESIAITIGLWMIGLIFAAGGAWVTLKESRRHVNGLGSKFNASEKERQDQHNRLCLAVLALANEEQKKVVISCITSPGGNG